MSKIDDYRQALTAVSDWDAYLLVNSNLPGPRGNLELAHAAADLADAALLHRYRQIDARQAPVNTPHEFLAFVGVLGLGRLISEGAANLDDLRPFAADGRWRVREAVAMALQRVGMADLPGLLVSLEDWARGTPWEQRAAAAGLCEPALLRRPDEVTAVLHLLDAITATIPAQTDRRADAFQALRKGLAYCWSVAIAANPTAGKPLLEKWLASADKDVRWIMRENLKKKRLERMDAAWVARCLLSEESDGL